MIKNRIKNNGRTVFYKESGLQTEFEMLFSTGVPEGTDRETLDDCSQSAADVFPTAGLRRSLEVIVISFIILFPTVP